jgi:hypothetical protein
MKEIISVLPCLLWILYSVAQVFSELRPDIRYSLNVTEGGAIWQISPFISEGYKNILTLNSKFQET